MDSTTTLILLLIAVLIMHLIEEIKTGFRRRLPLGKMYRITPQRLAILKILAASNGHPSAERIFDQIKEEFPTTSLATVYKTIATLKGMGEVLELGFADDSNRYDGNKPYPHTHLICVKCRDITMERGYPRQ